MITLPSAPLATEVQPCFPLELCCNCGGHADLRVVPTTLRKTTYLGVGGLEKTFTVPLPYCAACEVTAKRIPKGLGAKLLVSLLVTMALMLAYAVAQAGAARPLLPFGSNAAVFWSLAALSAAVVFGAYAIRRPRGTQTSWYQPVRLVKMRQKFVSGTVVGYVFAFSSVPYRQRFAAVNAEAISRRVLDARTA